MQSVEINAGDFLGRANLREYQRTAANRRDRA